MSGAEADQRRQFGQSGLLGVVVVQVTDQGAIRSKSFTSPG